MRTLGPVLAGGADLLGENEYQTVRVSQNWVNGQFDLRRSFLGESSSDGGIFQCFLGCAR